MHTHHSQTDGSWVWPVWHIYDNKSVRNTVWLVGAFWHQDHWGSSARRIHWRWSATRWHFGSTGERPPTPTPEYGNTWGLFDSDFPCAHVEQVHKLVHMVSLQPGGDSRLSKSSPDSLLRHSKLHLLRRVSAHVDRKWCIKEGNPTVCLLDVPPKCPLEQSRAKCLYNPPFTPTHSVCFLKSFLLVQTACARIYPLGEPKWTKNKSLLQISVRKTDCFHSDSRCVQQMSAGSAACMCLRVHMMLTYLVPCFVGFLHQHSPLVVQLHGHAAAAVGVLSHPAEELFQLPPQGGVGVTAGFGVTRAGHQALWMRGRAGGRGVGGVRQREKKLRRVCNVTSKQRDGDSQSRKAEREERGQRATKTHWRSSQCVSSYWFGLFPHLNFWQLWFLVYFSHLIRFSNILCLIIDWM